VIIKPSTDRGFIIECVTHPKVWPHVTCDGVDSFNPDGHVFVEAVDGQDRLGVFMLHPLNPALVEIHTALLPHSWGVKAAQAAKSLLEYLAGKNIKKAITMVPQDNPLAKRFAIKAGMRVEGRITKSYPKGGVMLDQDILGVELCQ
jgi:RimJ/RimL family protein N-acetyltransferase